MKPKLLVLACIAAIACGTATIHSQEPYQTVVVTTASGNLLKFDLSEGVNVEFTDTEMKITGANAQAALPLTDFARFDFSTESAGVDNSPADAVKITLRGGSLSISGLQPQSAVGIIALNGTTVASARCDSTGAYSSPALPTGVYIVKTDCSTFKIAIKQ
ncbi:MAG: hypothetical protein ACI4BC_01485 [Muribaculaceae bacterium]